MKSKWFAIPMILMTSLVLASCSGTASTPTQTAGGETAGATQGSITEYFTDPYAYCAAVGQIDSPDERYTGAAMTDGLFKDYLVAAGLDTSTDYPDTFKQMTIWRCMDSRVYACNFGANIPCNSKADTNQTPTQAMTDFCTQNPGRSEIPMSVTGHSTIYSWRCNQTTPEILDQIDSIDAAGYASSFWTLLSENAAASASQPEASVTTPAQKEQIVFYSNRDGGANNIYSLTIGTDTPFILSQDQNGYFSGPFSPDGTRLLFTGFGLTNTYVGVMNSDGSNPVDLTKSTDWDDSFADWSPDGTYIVFTSYRDNNNEIYMMDASGGQIARLTNHGKDDFAPAWSPDGYKIAFLSDRDNQTGIYSIYLMNTDGSGLIRLTNDGGNDYTPRWSPDGSKIAFRSIQDGQSDIYTIEINSSKIVNLTNSPAEEWSPAWSSDGSQIAFQTNRDGNWEIYIMNADGSNPTNVTNDPSDDQLPFWKP
jgi:Tol biopolymer transport system component